MYWYVFPIQGIIWEAKIGESLLSHSCDLHSLCGAGGCQGQGQSPPTLAEGWKPRMYLLFLFWLKNLIKYRTFLLETRVNPKLRYASGIVRFELICLHQPQLHKAFPIHPQAPCGCPAQTQHLGQHSRGYSTMEFTLQLGHFQPAQVHILTQCKKSLLVVWSQFLRSTALGISDAFSRGQFRVTPKGICGTLVKEKKFPEMRPFLLTAMVTVHKGASQEQPRWLVQHYTQTHPWMQLLPRDFSASEVCEALQRRKGNTADSVPCPRRGVWGYRVLSPTAKTNRKVTLHSDSIKRMLRQTWRVESGRAPGLFPVYQSGRSKAFLEVQNTLGRKGSSMKMQLPCSRLLICKTSKLLKPIGHTAVLRSVEFYSFSRGCRDFGT